MYRSRAFTLVETILYLALFNIIFFSVITWAITLTQSNRNAEYRNAVERNAIFVAAHLADTYRQGLSVDENESVFNLELSSVRIQAPEDYFDYSVSGNRLFVERTGGTYILTDRLVEVTSFEVVPVDHNDVIVGTRIRITLRAEKYPSVTKTIESYYAFR